MSTDGAAFQLLQNALSAAQLSQQVYANNIANVSTPGYKEETVNFEAALQNAMSQPTASGVSTDGSSVNWDAMLQVQPTVSQDSSTVISNNGNNVDINAQMAGMAENQIRYNALVQDVQLRLQRYQTAINGG
ncbi:flagellar basal body rod protein FlgB [Alicyclobacillus cycloheptanicus]|uniref:Flagellar basal body rod protein FlgB n=1 Tax=Alicyclobacillus cycloheptanicus TaxID=1457 RepID=A0ABT9XKI4_9BACL|nr:flagellar basal body rod protein FlgB [Alicyclobacillus cycloheptanicus]MDQ0190564.1 flagellar basal-body rod protein FlgB [Alicyclobacillus cycloheptanicus]WDM01405.1 flagellar basal body rod protein FlgB [Alicyclobacillus cycloheptanicus]